MTKMSEQKADEVPQERLERIRQRAYELYEVRGREEGHDFDDWLQAEAEIEALEMRKTKAGA